MTTCYNVLILGFTVCATLLRVIEKNLQIHVVQKQHGIIFKFKKKNKNRLQYILSKKKMFPDFFSRNPAAVKGILNLTKRPLTLRVLGDRLREVRLCSKSIHDE